MVTRRNFSLALGAGALLAPFGSFAQPADGKGVHRLGLLSGGTSILKELSNEDITVSIDDCIRLNVAAMALSIFVGTEQKLAVSLDDLHPPREVQLDLASIGLRGSIAFASMILLGEEDVARVADGLPLHTDNDPVLEFSDMKYYLMSNSIDNLELLLEHKREDLSSYFETTPRTLELIKDVLRQAEAKHRSSIRYFRQTGD